MTEKLQTDTIRHIRPPIKTDTTPMAETLRNLITQASSLAGDNLCATDHDWHSNGGRPCPHDFVDSLGYECTGQTVYQCSRCGEYDYGDPGGPAFNECDNCQNAVTDGSTDG